MVMVWVIITLTCSAEIGYGMGYHHPSLQAGEITHTITLACSGELSHTTAG